MLFSKRECLARQCEEWCANHGAPVTPLNIITAADNLGFIGQTDFMRSPHDFGKGGLANSPVNIIETNK